MFFNGPENTVISVSTLNHRACALLENNMSALWISGELSNVTLAASGHAYFSLKDATAQVRCVMFRHRLAQLNVRLTEGINVELKGLVTLYEARGEFQINVETLRLAGIGQLFEAFERLKTRLAQEGLFDAARKRPLPRYPNSIGVVTSPSAAALRDVLTTLRRRMPTLPIILYPTPVQGEAAAAQIEAALHAASQRHEVEVLILCRGGGSIEDLWPFNDERVARAILASPIPIISGIGHETDFTICDFVADQRAPTPTAAAELASPHRYHLLSHIEQIQRQLYRALVQRLTDKSQHLDRLAHRLSSPSEQLAQRYQRLRQASTRLIERTHALTLHLTWRLHSLDIRLNAPRALLARDKQRLTLLIHTLKNTYRGRLTQYTQRLIQQESLLHAMNPHAVLARGYAIVEKKDGTVAHSPDALENGERVTLRLAHGKTYAVIDHSQHHP